VKSADPNGSDHARALDCKAAQNRCPPATTCASRTYPPVVPIDADPLAPCSRCAPVGSVKFTGSCPA
jgi:hypothetical protein